MKIIRKRDVRADVDLAFRERECPSKEEDGIVAGVDAPAARLALHRRAQVVLRHHLHRVRAARRLQARAAVPNRALVANADPMTMIAS